MRKNSLVSLIVCFFAASFSFANPSVKVIDKFFTSENLNLRAAPSTDAKKIVTIPKHTVVYVIQEGPEQKIDGKTAKWKKVVCDKFENNGTYKAGTTGWVFSEYLSYEDTFTDEEIEKILVEYTRFDNSLYAESVYGFAFYKEGDKKEIHVYRHDSLPGTYEVSYSTFYVKDGKIFLDKPFEKNHYDDWNTASSYFYDEEGNKTFMTLRRENSTEGEYCLCNSYGCDTSLKSKPSESSLILEYDILINTEPVSLVLPCDCIFYKEPNGFTKSFPDVVSFENDDRDVLVYNLDRVFKGQKVYSSKWYVNEEEVNGVKGRWYYLGDICYVDSHGVWIFVPGTIDPNAKEIPLTVQTFIDAQNKGLLNCRVLTQKDIELISNTHHHMNPWIDSCLDTFPWGK